MWEREESLPDEIRKAWESGESLHNLGDVVSRLRKVMSSLKRWSHEQFGAVTKELTSIRKKMEELETQDPSANHIELVGLRKRMDELLYREEMMWLQRSPMSWLKEGDRNTKFFHRKAVGRAKRNRIKFLKKEDGQITEDKKEMATMTCNFFKELYRADPKVNPPDLLQFFEERISDETNDGLCKDFSDQEISDALFQIGPIKVPGPDGFPAHFFQRNWGTLIADVIKAVKDFFVTSQMPVRVKDIAIILIPKKDEPELLKDFRLTSLCNVIYKVVSKCLVNRLRPMLQDIIGPMQSAFVPGRMVTDNALIAFECLHAIKHGNNSCKKFGAYKLDLTKAYDRMDWGFMEGVMRRLGFQSKWVQWVMVCVTTV
jgi:hypothetical protein